LDGTKSIAVAVAILVVIVIAIAFVSMKAYQSTSAGKAEAVANGLNDGRVEGAKNNYQYWLQRYNEDCLSGNIQQSETDYIWLRQTASIAKMPLPPRC